MIGYVTLGTNDIQRAAKFYDALLGSIIQLQYIRGRAQAIINIDVDPGWEESTLSDDCQWSIFDKQREKQHR